MSATLKLSLAGSKTQMQKIQVRIHNDYKLPFTVEGAFPSYISEINTNNRCIANVNIKEGDQIININEQNVSRASARSVKKIFKSCQELTILLHRPAHYTKPTVLPKQQATNTISKFFKRKCNLFKLKITNKSLMSCINPTINHHEQSVTETTHEKSTEAVTELCNSKQVDETTDHGYLSLPVTTASLSLTSSQQTTSYSSITTSSSKSSGFCETEVNSVRDTILEFKEYIENFIQDVQCGIETYVRPSVVLKTLTQQEGFELYQNVEKLIPVARFLLSIISQFESSTVNTESLNIVFTAFRTYLGGLLNAMTLLSQLTEANENFIMFMEKLTHQTLPIVDFIFMPFKFVCRMLEFFEAMELSDSKMRSNLDELYKCTVVTQYGLEQQFQAE